VKRGRAFIDAKHGNQARLLIKVYALDELVYAIIQDVFLF
jgi:hypothetical protein